MQAWVNDLFREIQAVILPVKVPGGRSGCPRGAPDSAG